LVGLRWASQPFHLRDGMPTCDCKHSSREWNHSNRDRAQSNSARNRSVRGRAHGSGNRAHSGCARAQSPCSGAQADGLGCVQLVKRSELRRTNETALAACGSGESLIMQQRVPRARGLTLSHRLEPSSPNARFIRSSHILPHHAKRWPRQ
jgi:hypothetical protein